MSETLKALIESGKPYAKGGAKYLPPGVEVEHKDGYCIASRPAEHWTIRYNASYEDHAGDPAAAEAHARAKVAERESWE